MLLCALLAGAPWGCAWQRTGPKDAAPPLGICTLVEQACRVSRTDARGTEPAPDYLNRLLEDNVLTVGLGIGTADLGFVNVPAEAAQRCCLLTRRLHNRTVEIRARMILTREDFSNALAECEIVFVTSHSRYGAGPVFLLDGKDMPFRMQRTLGYEIIMPDTEVSGYPGRVTRRYHDPVRRSGHTVFAPDSTDLDRSRPLPGYQLLVLSTCTSGKHFLDEITAFRAGLPTTAVFTRRACLMDTDMRIFMRLLAGVFAALPIQEVVAGMNREYRNVAWGNVRRGRPPWNVIDELYRIGIHTVGREHEQLPSPGRHSGEQD